MKRFEEGDSVIVTKNTVKKGLTGEVTRVRESTKDSDGNEIGNYEVDFRDGEKAFYYSDDDLEKAPPQVTP